MTFFRSCFSFVFDFVFACFLLVFAPGGEQGKWDVSSAGTFKTGGQDLGLYICNDRKDGRMQYEETNRCRFIFSQQWPVLYGLSLFGYPKRFGNLPEIENAG
jgi:hypothetical protein